MDREKMEAMFTHLGVPEELRQKFWQASTDEEQAEVLNKMLHSTQLTEEDLEKVAGGFTPKYECFRCGFITLNPQEWLRHQNLHMKTR